MKTDREFENNALNFEKSEDMQSKKIFIISKMKKVSKWTEDEDKILKTSAKKFDYKNWNAVADHLPGRSAIQCSARFKRIKPGRVKGSWTEEEDRHLMILIKKFGKNFNRRRNGKKYNNDVYRPSNLYVDDEFIQNIKTKYPSIHDRTNIKEWNVFTIDPQNSLDFDDGFSIIERENGIHQLSIYISSSSLFLCL
jgi:hypothetical protein